MPQVRTVLPLRPSASEQPAIAALPPRDCPGLPAQHFRKCMCTRPAASNAQLPSCLLPCPSCHLPWHCHGFGHVHPHQALVEVDGVLARHDVVNASRLLLSLLLSHKTPSVTLTTKPCLACRQPRAPTLLSSPTRSKPLHAQLHWQARLLG